MKEESVPRIEIIVSKFKVDLNINTCQDAMGQPRTGKTKDMAERLCGAAVKRSGSGAGWLHAVPGPGLLYKGFRQP